MSIYALALLIGVVAGLRCLTAPAAVSWAIRLGWLTPANAWLALLGEPIAPYICSALALGELINDKLPKTPSRKAPIPFAARILMGALCGAALCAPRDAPIGGAPIGSALIGGALIGSALIGSALIGGALAGAAGAVAGTLGGYEARSRLVRATGGKDFPIALLEDAIAICGALWIVS